MQRSTTCCFTGHRPARLPWGEREDDPRCQLLKAALDEALEDAYALGYRHFIGGMAQGCDLYFCEAVLRLRESRTGVTLEAAVPFPGQADRWDQASRGRYQRLLEQCDFETVVQHSYTPGCLQRRNRYMVDRSSLLLAAFDGLGAGGTRSTILYAMQQQLRVVQLPVEP